MKKNKLEKGMMFSFWEVIEYIPKTQGRKFKCICRGCGVTHKIIDKFALIRQKTKSCGCQKSDLTKQTLIDRYGFEHHTQSPEWKSNLSSIEEKRRNTCLEKYGVQYAQQSQQIKEQKKQTCLKKYGVENPSQAEEFKEQKKQTCLKKYGVENPSQSSDIQDKIKQTSQQKYGTDFYILSNDFKKRAKQSNVDKYGVESFSQTALFKEKFKNTSLERYGCASALIMPASKEQAKKTCLEKYGVESFSQTMLFTKRLKDANLANYGVEYLCQLPQNRNKLRNWCEDNPNKLWKSKSEVQILTWIQQLYPSACKLKTKHELDIFIPELWLGIEHNGLYHHSEIKKPNNYHLNKTNFFKSQGIRTIHIWEHEWRYKQEQVKSFLLSALGKNKYKIGARKCTVVWSASKAEIQKAHDLLDSTHIQGHTNSTKYVTNVYYQDILVATATFGKHHRNSKEWVLSRFTTKTNYTIQGILSKISKLASKQLQSDIISWADYRLSQGNGYEKAGWKSEELLAPDYFYHKNGKVISKQSRQKRIVNTPSGMTEHQHALQDGLSRVYDCGKIRYRYNYEF